MIQLRLGNGAQAAHELRAAIVYYEALSESAVVATLRGVLTTITPKGATEER
jgi:hypothetical protein